MKKPFRVQIPHTPSSEGSTSCSKATLPPRPVLLCTCLGLFHHTCTLLSLHFSSQKHHLSLSHKPDRSNTFYKRTIPGEQTRRKPSARRTVKVPKESIPFPDPRCKMHDILSIHKLPTPEAACSPLHPSRLSRPPLPAEEKLESLNLGQQ